MHFKNLNWWLRWLGLSTWYFTIFFKEKLHIQINFKTQILTAGQRKQTLSNWHLPLKLATGNPSEIAVRFQQAGPHLPDFSRVPKKGGTKPKVASETTSYVELVFPTISDMNQWASNPQNKTTQSRLCGFAFLCNPYTRGEVGMHDCSRARGWLALIFPRSADGPTSLVPGAVIGWFS